MRIGMILDATFPPDNRVEKEAISLIEAGHEVFLFCLNFKKLPPSENYKGIQIRRYPAGKLLYKLSALAYTFPFYRWLVVPKIKKFIRDNSIHILHVHDLVIAESAFNANKQHMLSIVLDLHENRPEIMRDYKHVNTLKGRLLINLPVWKRKYYEYAGKAEYVVVVTNLAKEDIVLHTKRNTESVIVVSNTVSLDELAEYKIDNSILERMKDSYNLLYIGDTSLRRGTDTAIQAISILIKEIPAIKLWLVGKSSADEELKLLTKRLNLTPYVMFEGWRDASLLPSYISGSHITLSPLKRNKHHDTTYANKIFQYMAMGKALVVSDCIAQAELIEITKSGLVHKANDPEDLASQILILYRKKEFLKQFGENGKLNVSKLYNWKVTSSDLNELYRKLEESGN